MAEPERLPPFVKEPPSQLVCPVCQCLFRQPVLVSCGHTVCQDCLKQIEQCPVDRSPIGKDAMQVPNKVIECQIKELPVRCSHGIKWTDQESYEIDESGCPEQMQLQKLAEHEAGCVYRMVGCRFCNNQSIRYKDLAEHIKACRQPANGLKGMDRTSANIDEFIPTIDTPSNSMCCTCCLELMKIHKENRELKTMIESLCERISSLETSQRASMEWLQSLFSPQLQPDRTRNTPSDSHDSAGVQLKNSTGIAPLGSRPLTYRLSSRRLERGSESWAMPFSLKCIGLMRGHQKAIRDMLVDGNTIITASEDGTVKVWDITLLIRGQVGNHMGKGSIATLTADSQHPLVWLHASRDFSTVFTGSDNGRVKRWTVRNLTQFTLEKTTKEEEELRPGEVVTCGVVSPRYIFTGTYRKIRVLSADSLALEQELDDLHHWVRALALSPDQQLLASGAHNQVHLWNANDLRLLYTIQEDFGSVYSLCLSRTMVVVGTYNRCVQAFDLKTRELVTSLLGQVSPSHHVYLTQCERFLIVASGDGSVQIWDFVQGLLIQEMRRHEKAAYVVDMAESLIFSAGEDKEIKVFKYAKMENVR